MRQVGFQVEGKEAGGEDRAPTVAVATLGCKVNQFESASFESGFTEKGFSLMSFSRPADIYVINTCAVTAKASAQSRQLIRRALRANPAARFVVTGCYAQVASAEIEKLSDAPLRIISNNEKHLLVDMISGDIPWNEGCKPVRPADIRREKEICRLPVRRFAGRTRAFLKVQDGCNSFCSYCIVPYARGRSRSQPPVEVVGQARTFSREGYREIVITGIHVGAYGRDLLPASDLPALMRELVAQVPGVRYRISSLEPTEITSELLRFMAETENCMPHLHIPLQSGDDTILNRMNRRYGANDFVRVVNEIFAHMPEAAIGVDVLAGFPGESRAAFERTFRLLEELPVAYLHAFPYSVRPGTAAAAMPEQVDAKIKEERVARLRELDNKKRAAFYTSQLGKVRPVLVEEGRNRSQLFKGFTDNYIPVHFQAPERLANRIVDVRLERLAGRQLFGTVRNGPASAPYDPGRGPALTDIRGLVHDR